MKLFQYYLRFFIYFNLFTLNTDLVLAFLEFKLMSDAMYLTHFLFDDLIYSKLNRRGH